MNTRAVSMIGERFEGARRARLLGFRQSAETIGQTFMTLVAGQLLILSWKSSFLVYTFSFLVLILYLAFVPAANSPETIETRKDEQNKKQKMTRDFSLFT